MTKTIFNRIFTGIVTVFAFGVCVSPAFSQTATKNPLLILPEDIRIEQAGGKDFEAASGYHLYIRKKPGLESVMLTETTKDPNGTEDNYSYRATEYNPVNGDEIRLLEGKKLESESAKYSLIDSTPERDAKFGESFHIYIPSTIVYGYPWTRNGTVKIGKGTFINIRGFSKKYCDYTGNYFDNPYMFNLERRKIARDEIAETASSAGGDEKNEGVVLTDGYNPAAAEKFDEISDTLIYADGPDSLVGNISDILSRINPKNKVDIVFAIDATGSMKNDIELLRRELVPALETQLARDFKSVRIGLLLYRDYGDNFMYKNLPVKYYPFTDDLNVFLKNLNGFTIKGNEGGDIPEAVYEALYSSLEFYDWREDASRRIVLIGDAEPHPKPRGSKKYSRELVEQLAKEKRIPVSAIILPDDKARRGR